MHCAVGQNQLPITRLENVPQKFQAFSNFVTRAQILNSPFIEVKFEFCDSNIWSAIFLFNGKKPDGKTEYLALSRVKTPELPLFVKP
jgi:hypothetical protein